MATPTGIALLRDGVHRVCREWSSDGGSDVPLDMLEQQGNALPAVEYTTRTGEPVVVRSLAVNGRLFVHFVKNQVSTRVDLRCVHFPLVHLIKYTYTPELTPFLQGGRVCGSQRFVDP